MSTREQQAILAQIEYETKLARQINDQLEQVLFQLRQYSSAESPKPEYAHQINEQLRQLVGQLHRLNPACTAPQPFHACRRKRRQASF